MGGQNYNRCLRSRMREYGGIFFLAQDGDQEWACVNTVMNLNVSKVNC
jgi:hypothetical protein